MHITITLLALTLSMASLVLTTPIPSDHSLARRAYMFDVDDSSWMDEEDDGLSSITLPRKGKMATPSPLLSSPPDLRPASIDKGYFDRYLSKKPFKSKDYSPLYRSPGYMDRMNEKAQKSTHPEFFPLLKKSNEKGYLSCTESITLSCLGKEKMSEALAKSRKRAESKLAGSNDSSKPLSHRRRPHPLSISIPPLRKDLGERFREIDA
ncbi:hypothetical protein BJ684DRAFT_16392 [Piptocephalis cylindrospora]|uniref:Uncharacterized protein n=1 Tax=Piptocephalis cylindrospora TaxID=1907219 RepID=A0A4P9Y2V8_9FUNG|nr:hypothetical protein BJ684DRAFT_16392 [Piptocephalis cylindrospora]|eukprot:RKP13185.1 hypothetical protein BJ684DRAFT_16392 [Piptocephalis cylindrospora]